MQEIEFYCKACKKSIKMYYTLTGNKDIPVMDRIIIRCHTHKCTRAVILRHFTEGDIIKKIDVHNRCYI